MPITNEIAALREALKIALQERDDARETAIDVLCLIDIHLVGAINAKEAQWLAEHEAELRSKVDEYISAQE